MTWTMPRPVLQVVAGLLALSAVGAFAMGIVNASSRGGRLPGERAAGQGGPATQINATEATPLAQERIEGPAPAAKAANTTDDQADEDVADQPTNAIPPAKTAEAAKPAAPQAPADKIGDVLQNAAPPPEEPPH